MLASSPRLSRLAAAWPAALVAAALPLSACTVDVTVGFGTCEWNGETYEVGESFPAGDGCNSCSCEEGGNVGCTLMACAVCEYGGQGYQPGDTFPAGDGCNTCTCGEDGSIACTEIACSCGDTPPPECPQPGSPDCYAQAECDPAGLWTCVTYCDGCTGEPPPCAPPPDGCDWTGLECIDGMWSCGDIICPNGCFYGGAVYAVGDVFPAGDGCNSCQCLPDGSVACTDMACPTCMTEPPSCAQPPPDTGCYAIPTCVDGVNWECSVYCQNACPEPAPDCPPSMLPECFTSSVCTDQGWVCQESCLPEVCGGPLPVCPLGPPNCSFDPVCTSMGWECQATCFGACDMQPPPDCMVPPGCDGGPVCTDLGWSCQVACPGGMN